MRSFLGVSECGLDISGDKSKRSDFMSFVQCPRMPWPKECPPFLFAVLSTNVDRLPQNFTRSILKKLATQLLMCPLHLDNDGTLPWEKLISDFLDHSGQFVLSINRLQKYDMTNERFLLLHIIVILY